MKFVQVVFKDEMIWQELIPQWFSFIYLVKEGVDFLPVNQGARRQFLSNARILSMQRVQGRSDLANIPPRFSTISSATQDARLHPSPHKTCKQSLSNTLSLAVCTCAWMRVQTVP